MKDRKLEIHCDASPDAQLHVKTQALSVAISQSVNRDKTEENWQSVFIICEQTPEGLLTTKFIVGHGLEPEFANCLYTLIEQITK